MTTIDIEKTGAELMNAYPRTAFPQFFPIS